MMMTPKVTNRMRSRYAETARRSTIVSGIASAAASETTPRTPINDSTNGHCQGGDGSRRASDGISQRGR